MPVLANANAMNEVLALVNLVNVIVVNVVTRLRCDVIFNHLLIARLLVSPLVKEL